MRQKSRLARLLGAALCSIAFAGALGCQTHRVGKPPPCPQYSAEALADLARVIESGAYPELERQIGEQENHCDAIERLRSGDMPEPAP